MHPYTTWNKIQFLEFRNNEVFAKIEWVYCQAEFEKTIVFRSYFPENCGIFLWKMFEIFLNFMKLSKGFGALLNVLGFSKIYEDFLESTK